jgi:hypothetical protein
MNLDNPLAPVRWAVANTLRQAGAVSAGPAPLARLDLPETDLDTRRMLIRALGAVHYTPAIPTLTARLCEPDPQQRGAAAWSLAALDAREAIPAVVNAYASERDRHARKRPRYSNSPDGRMNEIGKFLNVSKGAASRRQRGFVRTVGTSNLFAARCSIVGRIGPSSSSLVRAAAAGGTAGFCGATGEIAALRSLLTRSEEEWRLLWRRQGAGAWRCARV